MKGFIVWICCILMAGCAPAAVYGGRSEAGDALVVRALVVRWAIERFDPGSSAEEIDAVCLRAPEPGRRPNDGERMETGRSTAYDPTPRLLSQLSDVQPKVIPYTECGQDGQRREWVISTGRRAVAVSIGYPRWVTPDEARVALTIVESRNRRDGIECRVARRLDGWQIRSCV